MTIRQLSKLPPKTLIVAVLIIGFAAGGVAAIRYALNEFNSVVQQPPTAVPVPTITTEVAASATAELTADAASVADTETPVPTSAAATQTAINTLAPLADESPLGETTLELTDGVYLRAGPSVEYAILGSEPAGYIASVTGKSADGQWYQIAYGARTRVWVSALWSSVQPNTADIPVVDAPATPTPEASVTPASTTPAEAAPTATSDALAANSSTAISGKTFSIETEFIPGTSTPRYLIGAPFNVNMRIVNSSSSEVSFGAWGVHSNLYPNFLYIFNGDRAADKIGPNTEYSWTDSVSILNAGVHNLQMGICLDNAANCLASKAPGTNWFILSEAIPITFSESRIPVVVPEGSPITGTYFSAEKTCTAGSSCTTSYAVNESIWVNLRIHNPGGDDQKFGAWGVYANPYIFRFFNGDSDADKVAAGTEFVWRDHIEIPASGTYDLRMAICTGNSTDCGATTPPAAHWYFLSDAIPVTIN
jgi:uncharacterized protein YgiM (DUF1202 family)